MTLPLFQQHRESLKKKLSLLKKKLAHIEKNQKTSEIILSHIHDALLFIDFQGIIKQCNQQAGTLFAIDPITMIALPYSDFFDDGLFGFSMKEMLEKKCEKKHLILTLHRKEDKLQLEVTTTLIPDEGMIILLRDRSDIDKLEKTIQENTQLKALGEMAATLAHEIRNPLGGIEGFASLLLKEAPHQKTMIEAILEGTRLLNALVTNVLEYARPCVMNFASISLKQCLEHLLLYLSIKERARVVIECPEDLTLIADEMHFKRALLNLVQNALEASTKAVIIVAEKEGILTIKDRGKGIPKEHLEKIMTPFFTTKIKGTGLGLSEVHKILKAHEFELKILSSSKGTTVTIVFGGGA